MLLLTALDHNKHENASFIYKIMHEKAVVKFSFAHKKAVKIKNLISLKTYYTFLF